MPKRISSKQAKANDRRVLEWSGLALIVTFATCADSPSLTALGVYALGISALAGIAARIFNRWQNRP